jgi:uncharacterized protein (TIGR02246 family)
MRATIGDPTLQTLLDERDIRALIRGGWAAIDRKDWDTYANAFAADGVFEIMGQRRHGREEIVAGPARDLAHFAALQHVITNEIVEVDGDEAHGQWYAIAVHVPSAEEPDRHADVGLRYRFTARRTDEGWRLADVALEPLWTSGLSFDIPDAGEG